MAQSVQGSAPADRAQVSAASELKHAQWTAVELEELFDAMYEQIRRVFRSRSFFVGIYEENEDEWYVVFDTERGQRAPAVRFQATAGYTGYVIHERRPLLLRSARESAEFRRQHSIELIDEEAKSWLGVPLIAGDKVTGVVVMQDYEQEGLYDQGDVALLQTMAAQAALVLRQAQLLTEERAASRRLADRVRALECLNDVSQTVEQALTTEGFLAWVVGRLPQAMRFPDAALSVVTLEGHIYGNPRALEMGRHIERPIEVGRAPVGKVRIAYAADQEFLESEKALLDEVVGRVSGYIEQQKLAAERERLLTALERRNVQLRAAAEVSGAASTILDLEELIRQAVWLIRERFDYYYVGLFLVNQDEEYAGGPNRWAVLRAGTGEPGRQMMARGHRLEIGGHSMIGQCVALGKARIALDVGQEAQRFENPLLPETRSEMALPLISRSRAIGALTIQSQAEAAFSQEDVTALQAMAEQLAVAIENARLFEEMRLRAERERVVRTVTDKIRRGTDAGAIARAGLEGLSQILGTPDLAIRLGTQEQLQSWLRQVQSERGRGAAEGDQKDG